LAKAIKSGFSATIGAIIPDVATPFFSVVIRGLTDAARSAGFEVMVANSDNDPEIESRTIELLEEKRVDGIIVAPAFQDHPATLLRLVEDFTPIVLLDRRLPALSGVPSVSIDNVGATRMATEHLLSLGHRRITIVTEAKELADELLSRAESEDVALWLPASQRLLGYLQACRDANVAIDDQLTIRCDYNSSSAATAVGRLLDTGIDVSAMLCTDAALTYGAYRELVDRDILVPDGISFVGFDDQDWTTLVKPAVTIIEQPRYRLGSACTNMLLAQIRGLGDETSRVQLPAALIARGSTTKVVHNS
jgi:LacI family transcriptional regulator